jgi:hypothetical protein
VTLRILIVAEIDYSVSFFGDEMTSESDSVPNAATIGAKGGKARAHGMTAEQRSEAARKAVEARWSAGIPAATDEGVLRISGKEIVCAVLDDERRVLNQETFLTAIGRAAKAKAGTGSTRINQVDELPPFLAAANLKPFISDELRRSTKPIIYKTASGGRAFGYEATLLPEICLVYLEAEKAGKLKKNQIHIAAACKILYESLANVAIIALVDEATGFQYKRSNSALERFLTMWIDKKLAPWVRRFPPDFYRMVYRLKGWKYDANSTARSPILGVITNDLVYARLAPLVLKEMQKLTPKNKDGRRKHKFHQLLTEDFGIPELREHFRTLVMIGAGYDDGDYGAFRRHVGRALPLQPQDADDALPLFEGLMDDEIEATLSSSEPPLS